MAETANLGKYLIGTLIVITISVALGTMYIGFSDTYGTSRTDNAFGTIDQYQRISNLTQDVSDNVRETGIKDESSTSQVISVGWSSWKLFLSLPGILGSFVTSLSTVMNVNVAGINFVNIGIMILTVWVIWTLIYSLFFGRS